MKTAIPEKLQGLLWSADVSDLDLINHKQYIIHQTLMFGTIEELKWLFSVYTMNEIRDVFINHPSKNYTPSAFYFAQHVLLDIPQKLQPEHYVRTSPRYIGS